MPRSSLRCIAVALVVAVSSGMPWAAAGAQNKTPSKTAAAAEKKPAASNKTRTVELIGLSGQHRTLTAADLAKLPHVEATIVSVEAADNYRVVFALAEVDSGFTNKVIFLADSKAGQPLDALEGPFHLIVPDEKRPARWAKQVVRIRLIAIK
jgi:hypothetical protein